MKEIVKVISKSDINKTVDSGPLSHDIKVNMIREVLSLLVEHTSLYQLLKIYMYTYVSFLHARGAGFESPRDQ